MGAPKEDYMRVAPNHSFIHVTDFDGPKALGEHIRHLLKDRRDYADYFAWRQDGAYEFISTKMWCRLCALLNEPRPKTYGKFHAWWTSGDRCIKGESTREKPQQE